MILPMINLLIVYFYIRTFRSICAVPIMVVFGSSLIFYFHVMLLRFFLNDSETVPAEPVITGTTFDFIFHMCPISIVRF